ncbi:unnamed protein product [Phytophthora fragariaefolia]|uniref:Unnamed protein product n=1 Tax=Phytophthora fragariaefolia TaxID=1490495 RepID=A0A9W7D0R3_9STRA|nr:unnamed protein product [Phytophthora fragariaefolia]
MELSASQNRRLSIAIELLSNSSMPILDEPMSSLNPSAMYNITKFSIKLRAEGKTVVCTFYLTSSLVYEISTKVVELSSVICCSRAKMISHFASSVHDYPQVREPG